MHPTLYIPELLRNIFSHCTRGDLAVLAGTCKEFKEPALDLLWEELDDLSPLVRCLPDASHIKFGSYYFNGPLSEAEQGTLRGYSRRIRIIRGFTVRVPERTMSTILYLEPLTKPPFPNLRSLYWGPWNACLVQRIAVPSLTCLYLKLYPPFALESLDVFADYCPHIKELIVQIICSEDVTISRQICRWSNLYRVDCPRVALSMDTIAHLSSAPNLKRLSFTAKMDNVQHILHHGSKLVFSCLTELHIKSTSIDTIALLLSHLRLPRVKELAITFSNYVSKRAIRAYWAAALEACPYIVSIHLKLRRKHGDPIPGEERLTLEYLDPSTAFSELRILHVDFDWHVHLTDADLLHLASPRMEKLIINDEAGWVTREHGEGITLSGLVRLLRQCPSLSELCVAIDTSTFTKIPEGLDVSFPPRKELSLNFVDSWIHPEFHLGGVSVLKTLGVDPYTCATRHEESWRVIW